MRSALLSTLVIAALCVSPCGHAFTLDTSFNSSGDARDYLDLGSSYTDVFADTAIAPGSGAYYSVGRSEYVSAGGATHGVLFKRLSNGSKDAAFHDATGATSRVVLKADKTGGSSSLDAVAFDTSGTGAVLAAGYNDLANGKRCGVVYKVLDNSVTKGLLDGGFGTAGRFSYCAADTSAITFSDIKALPDGRVLVTGNGALPSGERNGFLLRLTAAGQLDTTFNAGSMSGSPGRIDYNVRLGKDDSALRIAVGSQGYYVGGNTTYSRPWAYPIFNDDIDFWVSRVTPAGTMDNNFSPTGIRVDAVDVPGSDMTDLLADLAVDGSNRPLLLLNINPAHLLYNDEVIIDQERFGKSRAAILRYTTAGARDTSYGAGHDGFAMLAPGSWNCLYEYCEYDEPGALLVTPANEALVTGRYVPSGYWPVNPLDSKLMVTRVSSTGNVLSSETLTNWPRSEGAAIVRQADGRFVVGGLVRTTGTASDTDFLLARFLTP